MSDLCSLTLADAVAGLQKKEFGARELTQACLERISATEPQIHALLHVDADNALRKAEKMDESGPDSQKPLWGVPVTVKDALSTSDMPTTAASKILENFEPIYDAFAVEKLRDAGAIILGKNNMDEFAMGSSTENSAFQITRNPWNLEHVPGGSSGGSAASIAASQCFASLGSDTGGSIRQPAAFCGCVGLKPTYGRVSRYGLFAFGSSLDQIGPLTRTVEDCARVLEVIAGHDPRDATCRQLPVENYAEGLAALAPETVWKGARLGIPEGFFGAVLSDEVRDACENTINAVKDLGATLVEVRLPDPTVATAVYYIISMAEASSNLARYDGVRYGRRAAGVSDLLELYNKSRSQGFGQEVKRRIMLGSYVLSSGYYDAYFRKAAQTRRLIYNAYQDALRECDLICMPVAPVTAWKLGSHAENPLEAYMMDAYALPVNLAGLCGLSLPVGLGSISRLPVGMQLVGAPFSEKRLLRFGRALEKILPPIGAPKL